ncbi:MAG: TRAP transporter small permease [Desulfatiglans sp.]|jgi:TRAP-type C4-dicarboxylate transport system permease small subunit|nr:TRAP transporter small permease [Desulfatiglans sp.]
MSQGLLNKTDRALERLSNLFAALSGIMILFMAFTATYGVVRRYLFKSPEPYSYELSTIFLLWTFVLALAYLEKLDGHLRVDFFIVLLPEKIRLFLLNVAGPFFGLVFCSVLTWEGWRSAAYSLEIGETSMSVWAIPLFPVKIVIPFGYGLLCIVLLLKIIRGFINIDGRKM